MLFRNARYLAKGSSGYVFESGQGSSVIKIIPLWRATEHDKFINEVAIQTKLHARLKQTYKYSFVPNVRAAGILKRVDFQFSSTIWNKLPRCIHGYGVIIMESLGRTTLKKTNSVQMRANAMRELVILAKNGFINNDVHDENFMVRGNDVFMIDVALVKKLTPEQTISIKHKTDKEIVELLYPNVEWKIDGATMPKPSQRRFFPNDARTRRIRLNQGGSTRKRVWRSIKQ